MVYVIQVCWQLARRIRMEFQFHTDPAHTGLLTACEQDQDGISVTYWSCWYRFADSLRAGSRWNFSSILILLIQVCWQLARRIRMEFQFHTDPAHTGLLTACEKDQDGISVPYWSCSYRFADSLREGSGWNFSPILILLIRVCWQLARRIRMELQFHPDPARKLSANLYDIYHCCVYSKKLLMMDRGTVRNMQSFIPRINLRN